MRLVLHVPGATADQLARGVAAAQAVFDAARVTPWDGAVGYHARSQWDDAGFPDELEPTDEMARAAGVMDDAESAAIEACCAGRPEDPRRDAWLEVRQAEPSVADQIRMATKHWIDSATPDDLWQVLRHGGLSATILVADGLPQVMVQLDGDKGLLSSFGIINPELSGDEALALNAVNWGASEPPADGAAQKAWFVNQSACFVGGWRHLDQQIRDNGALFDSIADDWCASVEKAAA